MRVIRLVVLALMIPGLAAAQGRGPDPDRRAELEQRLRGQFLRQLAERLDLTEEQRTGVREVLAEGAEARRDLALESQALRIDLIQAVREDGTPMSRFQELLAQLDVIRAREQEIAQQEEAGLAEFLNPRQLAVFLMVRMQFNERLQQLRGRRAPGPGGGPDGPTGRPF